MNPEPDNFDYDKVVEFVKQIEPEQDAAVVIWTATGSPIAEDSSKIEKTDILAYYVGFILPDPDKQKQFEEFQSKPANTVEVITSEDPYKDVPLEGEEETKEDQALVAGKASVALNPEEEPIYTDPYCIEMDAYIKKLSQDIIAGHAVAQRLGKFLEEEEAKAKQKHEAQNSIEALSKLAGI
jgi:hypothetical protein